MAAVGLLNHNQLNLAYVCITCGGAVGGSRDDDGSQLRNSERCQVMDGAEERREG